MFHPVLPWVSLEQMGWYKHFRYSNHRNRGSMSFKEHPTRYTPILEPKNHPMPKKENDLNQNSMNWVQNVKFLGCKTVVYGDILDSMKATGADGGVNAALSALQYGTGVRNSTKGLLEEFVPVLTLESQAGYWAIGQVIDMSKKIAYPGGCGRAHRGGTRDTPGEVQPAKGSENQCGWKMCWISFPFPGCWSNVTNIRSSWLAYGRERAIWSWGYLNSLPKHSVELLPGF